MQSTGDRTRHVRPQFGNVEATPPTGAWAARGFVDACLGHGAVPDAESYDATIVLTGRKADACDCALPGSSAAVY